MARIIDTSKAHIVRVDRRNTLAAVREVVKPVRVASPGAQGPAGAAGEQGVPGPPGETEGSTFNAHAGSTIHGRRAVRVADGVLFHPDLSIVAHAAQTVGIALQSGNPGDLLAVRTAGRLSDSGWTLAPGPIYCGDDGVLTQVPPETGWLLVIGRAIDATTINVDIDTPIVRG